MASVEHSFIVVATCARNHLSLLALTVTLALARLLLQPLSSPLVEARTLFGAVGQLRNNRCIRCERRELLASLSLGQDRR